MPLKRLKTNIGVWLMVSLVLFVPPWFTFQCGKGPNEHPAQFVPMLFQGGDESLGAMVGLPTFALIFGIPALVIGWVLHCLIIIIKNAVTGKKTRETD